MYTDQKAMQPLDEPRELQTQEIAAVVEEYRQATQNAFAAGFDAVELHCASGYLPAQFLSTGTNQRSDQYGGCVENRARFALEVLRAMVGVKGAGRVGLRICPDNPFNDLQDDNPQQTFEYLMAELAPLDLAYLHVIRLPQGRVDNIELGQRYFGDRLIANESYDLDEGQMAVGRGEVSAVSYGRHYIGNPDLVERWRDGVALTDFDLATLYSAGAEGYTSYPRGDAD
jgi:N-ethylmaleimide reductase